jgi:hypothetical protein
VNAVSDNDRQPGPGSTTALLAWYLSHGIDPAKVSGKLYRKAAITAEEHRIGAVKTHNKSEPPGTTQ